MVCSVASEGVGKRKRYRDALGVNELELEHISRISYAEVLHEEGHLVLALGKLEGKVGISYGLIDGNLLGSHSLARKPHIKGSV